MTGLVYDAADLGAEYPALLELVLGRGDRVRPRGLLVAEVRPLVLSLADPTRCLVQRPGINRALMWMEVAQLLAGVYRADLYRAVAPRAAQLMTEFGAYGPRVSAQLPRVVEELSGDVDSRRAVVYVGGGGDLQAVRDDGMTDMPCTMSLQLFVRDGRVELHAHMRSWDLVWGLANDVPCFTSVQAAVANALGVPLGRYVHVAGSAHVYERHFQLQAVSALNQPLQFPVARGANHNTTAGARLAATQEDANLALKAFGEYLRLGSPVTSVPPQWRTAYVLWARRVTG